MILSKESTRRRIQAGRALLFSAREWGDEEIGMSLPSFANLMDVLEDYLHLQSQLAAEQEKNKRLWEALEDSNGLLVDVWPSVSGYDKEFTDILSTNKQALKETP